MTRVEAYRILDKMWCDVTPEQAEAISMAQNDLEFVDLMPNDMVSVVLCKDCKHSCLVGKGAKKLQICHNPESPWFDCEGLVEVADDFFCSYGEKDGDG